MSVKTPHYKFEAFTWGNIYSATVDKRRFSAIDNQLAYLSEIVGEGKLLGWDISLKETETPSIPSYNLTVSPGIGMIEITRSFPEKTAYKILRSFGPLDFNFEANETKYIYMKSFTDETIVGGVSGFSNITSVTCVNIIPPAVPKNLREIIQLRSYNQLAFEWDENTEIDFSYYSIRQILDVKAYKNASIGLGSPSAIIYKELAKISEIMYIVTELDDNTDYIFLIVAVDLSGNESDPAEIELTTGIDTRIPSPPLFLQAFPGNQSIQIIWDNSPSDNVTQYRVEVKLLDTGESITEKIVTANLADSQYNATYTIIENLQNYLWYEVIVCGVTKSGYESAGISKKIELGYSAGAGEVRDIVVDVKRSSFEYVGLEADISWKYIEYVYFPAPKYFLITFIENSLRVSEPIYHLSSADVEDYKENVKFIPFKDERNVIFYESIKEYTSYLIMIQTMDDNGNISNGMFIRIDKTKTYENLPAVTNVNITKQSDNSIVVSWENPSYSWFSYIIITSTITNLTLYGANDEIYVEEKQIGKATNFVVPSIYFNINSRYNFVITPIDVFETEDSSSRGPSYEISKNFIEDNFQDIIIDSPTGMVIEPGSGKVELQWEIDLSGEVEYYKIYRSVYSLYLASKDFSLIDTIPSSYNSYVDYTVINNITYAYFITSVNYYGNESTNPSESQYFLTNDFAIATPTQVNDLTIPTNLTVITKEEFDAKLNWNSDGTAVDGYEIYRSDDNKYSFECIGNICGDAVNYIDKDALLINNHKYYYMIRKYKNEVELFITGSNIEPVNSIILGSVSSVIVNGESQISIDNSLATKLLNLEDPIRNMTKNSLALHKHRIEDSLDKRIELRASAIITDLVTTDFKRYTTETNIQGAEEYILKITGTVNESYFTTDAGIKDVISIKQAQNGISPITYEIDTENGIVTFIEPLYTLCDEPIDPLEPDKLPCPICPYSSEPSLSLHLINITEVDNLLSEDKVENIYANQIISGEIDRTQIPSLAEIRHEGRIKEKLEPIKVPLDSKDSFVYSLANIYTDTDRNKMGNAVTFYDVVRFGDSYELLAATSSGIWYSKTNGVAWVKSISFDTAVYRIFRSSENNYYAITNYNIYINKNLGYGSWEKMNGLDYVKIIREIIESPSKNIYISTDLGVFRLNKDKPYVEDTWEQLSIFGVKSTEAYGLIYETEYSNPSITVPGRILVSNELGILESTNEGKSWKYISDLSETVKVRKFMKKDDYIFALTNTNIYRKARLESNFINIGKTNVEMSRNIIFYNNKLYITTNEGIKVCTTPYILERNDLNFVSVWPEMNIKLKRSIITSLNVVDDDLFIGTDRKLFILTKNNKLWLQYEQQKTVLPSVYLNGEMQGLGFYYNNENRFHNVTFDEKLAFDTKVEVVNKYNLYKAELGGWADTKYNASFSVYSNENIFGVSSLSIQLDNNEFINFEYPVFNDSNAYQVGAENYKTKVEEQINLLTGPNKPTGDELVELVRNIYDNINKFLSQLYIETRVIIEEDGTETKITLPKINVDLVLRTSTLDPSGEIIYTETLVGAEVNIVTGVFVFTNVFDKYDTLELNVYGCTLENIGEFSHKEIEDKFELANSGLPSCLSQIQQVNINKLNIFTERNWIEKRKEISPVYNSKIIIPVDDNSYDGLNSTLNYKEEKYEKDILFSLTYPTAILLIPEINEVFVGGKEGIISIDINSLEINEVEIADLSNEIIKQIYRYNEDIFVVSDKNIYQSTDYGTTWIVFFRAGLPRILCSLAFVNNTMIVGTLEGIYYKASEYTNWEKSKDSSIPVEIMADPDFLYVVMDDIYNSVDGYNFTAMKVAKNLTVNKIIKFKSAFYIATKTGLYTDARTFYSNRPTLSLVDLDEDSEISASLCINDIYTDENKLIAGGDNGTYYLIENDYFEFKENTFLDTIQKVLIVNDKIWLFGYDLLRIQDIDYPIRISTGIPL